MKEDKVFSHLDARRDFGFTPITFNEGINLEVEDYKKEKIMLTNLGNKHEKL